MNLKSNLFSQNLYMNKRNVTKRGGLIPKVQVHMLNQRVLPNVPSKQYQLQVQLIRKELIHMVLKPCQSGRCSLYSDVSAINHLA
jgi:hypothetical protein